MSCCGGPSIPWHLHSCAPIYPVLALILFLHWSTQWCRVPEQMPVLFLTQDRRKFAYGRERSWSYLIQFEYPSQANKFPCGNTLLLWHAQPGSLTELLKLPHLRVGYKPATWEGSVSTDYWVFTELGKESNHDLSLIFSVTELFKAMSKPKSCLWKLIIMCITSFHPAIKSGSELRNSHCAEKEADAEWLNEAERGSSHPTPPIYSPPATFLAALGCHLWDMLVNTAILSCPWAEPWTPPWAEYLSSTLDMFRDLSADSNIFHSCGEGRWEVQVPFPYSAAAAAPAHHLPCQFLPKRTSWGPFHSQSVPVVYYLQVKSFVTEGGQQKCVWISAAKAPHSKAGLHHTVVSYSVKLELQLK